MVYHPESVLFVHGINSNDEGWQTAITALRTELQQYYVPVDAVRLITADQARGLYRASQQPYLHTFNYGDRPNQSTHNRQAFDHIEWNTRADDRDNQPFTNVFARSNSPSYIQPAPHDDRRTLDERIDEIRVAYRPSQSGSDPSQLILVCHSMGGLLSHYYLIQNAADSGVRRLVTLGTPHLGSNVANWMLWDRNAGICAHIFDGMRSLFVAPTVRILGNHLPPASGATAGFYRYARNGGVEDITVNNPNASNYLRHHNELMDFFWDNPAPQIEYVFNAYCWQPGLSVYQAEQIVTWDTRLGGEQRDGDGVVAPGSAAGKPSQDDPSIWNGAAEVNENIHQIDPVIFGVWPNTDHSHALENTNSLFKSLVAVPYRWKTNSQPPNYSSTLPEYAHRYDENQSFSKYLPVSDQNACHTDEPGIADLLLLYPRANQNPLLIPTVDTWTVSDGAWQKESLAASDFSGFQIIAGGNGDSIQCVGTVGVKNRSENPVGMDGTNYWVVAGNEYLPASLKLQATTDTGPVTVLTSLNAAVTGLVNQCLVQLDENSTPQFQYGVFTNAGNVSVNLGTNNYVAVQGQNLGGLLTPQVERAFDAPIDSKTVVDILRAINERQDAAHVSTNLWTSDVAEWVAVTNSTMKLNFYGMRIDSITDAFQMDQQVEYSFSPTDRSLQFTADAPSYVVVHYYAYWGALHDMTAPSYDEWWNESDVTVPALPDDNALSGVPVGDSLIGQMQVAVDGLIPLYLNPETEEPWTKAEIFEAAGLTNTDWTAFTDGLAHSEAFSEIKEVVKKLTLLGPSVVWSAGTGNFTPAIVSFHTEGDARISLWQDDVDGYSLDWGVSAEFSFTPDPGHASVSGFKLTASWAAHGRPPDRRVNSQTHEVQGAVGTWQANLTMTGWDSADLIQIKVRPQSITFQYPQY